MNCSKGICKFRTDDNMCGKSGQKCDISKDGQLHTCHCVRKYLDFKLSCRDACYRYDICDET